MRDAVTETPELRAALDTYRGAIERLMDAVYDPTMPETGAYHDDVDAARATVAALLASAVAAERERVDALTPLARLGLAALEACRDGDDYEGYDIQDAAEKFGVVVGVPSDRPCGEDCRCEEYDADICYRDTPATTAARSFLTPSPGAGRSEQEKCRECGNMGEAGRLGWHVVGCPAVDAASGGGLPPRSIPPHTPGWRIKP